MSKEICHLCSNGPDGPGDPLVIRYNLPAATTSPPSLGTEDRKKWSSGLETMSGPVLIRVSSVGGQQAPRGPLSQTSRTKRHRVSVWAPAGNAPREILSVKCKCLRRRSRAWVMDLGLHTYTVSDLKSQTTPDAPVKSEDRQSPDGFTFPQHVVHSRW